MVDGIDISHHKGKVNWEQVAQAGVSFAFAKATEGITFVDKRFVENWQAMKDFGLIRGAYHYFRALQDPHQQADHFLSQVTLQPGDLAPVLDVENINNNSATRDQWINGVQTWLNHVQQTTGRTPIIYTRANFWNNKLTTGFGSFPLWVAHYEVQSPTIPNGWTRWSFWQHTDKGSIPGVNGLVDQNRFNGTIEQLQAFASI
jgi:lysozyme